MEYLLDIYLLAKFYFSGLLTGSMSQQFFRNKEDIHKCAYLFGLLFLY